MQHPPYPLMFDGGRRYEPLPLDSLTIDSALASLSAPYCLSVLFFTTTRELVQLGMPDGALAPRGILAGDVLLFDASRDAARDGAVQLDADGERVVARVCRVLADGWLEFHALAPGFPILSGERRILGTLAAVVRATEGREVGE